jgi:PadR family transcriptional regulator PadR
MTEQGLEFYAELERTWKELADAVQALTSQNGQEEAHTENPNNNS